MATNILEANRVPDAPGVFLVGGLARRVNVKSQQIRGFSTVMDLNDSIVKSDSKRSLADCNVAVVGAGACGLTVAATAGYLGARVTLLHKAGLLGGAHQESDHRFLHPNFNDWPFEAENPATDLPFLNWASDTGRAVTEQLVKGWEFVKHENGGRITEPLRNATLKEINFIDDKWFLTSSVKRGADRNLGPFDFVFLCLGFGDDNHELFELTSPAYWSTTDHKNFYNLQMNEFRDQALEADSMLNVFGNGDGGINECLQFVFKDFLPGDPSPNLLSFLHDSRITKTVKKIEAAADDKIRDLESKSAAKRREGLLKLGDDTWWQYVKALRGNDDLPDFKACFGRLNQEPLRKVRLFGKTSTPFNINATAINRTILCLAIMVEAVDYYRIDDLSSVPAAPEKKFRPYTSRHGWLAPGKLLGQDMILKEGEFICARFGPKSVYDGIKINGKPIPTDDVRRQQVRLIETEARREAIEIEGVLLERRSQFRPERFAHIHAKILSASIRRRFKAGFEQLHLQATQDEDGKSLFILNYKFSQRVEDHERSGWERVLPEKLMGIPVHQREIDGVMAFD